MTAVRKRTSGRRTGTAGASRARGAGRARAAAGLRRILVGLDGSSWSRAAVEAAADIARRTGAALTGVAVLDPKEIEEAVGPAPAGAIYFAEKREQQLLEKAREHVSKLIGAFRSACEKAKVPHFEHPEEGIPFRRLIHDSLSQDLVVLGLRTFFDFPPSDRPGRTLEKVLRHGVRPVLAVRQEPGPVRRVVVAFDDSAPAARTLQLFALLCPWELETLHLVHAGDDRVEALALLKTAESYLAAHGLDGQSVFLKGSPREAIPDYVSSQDMDLVVMGAYGRTGVSRILFGSLTATLLEEPRASLFLFH